MACIRDLIQTSWHGRPEVFQKGCGVHGVCSGVPPLYLGGMRGALGNWSRSQGRRQRWGGGGGGGGGG